MECCAVTQVPKKLRSEAKMCQVGKFCFRRQPLRYVEPFSIPAFYQPNVVVHPPRKIDVHQPVNVHTSLFRKLYLRGDIPCQRKFSRRNDGLFLHWKVPPQDLDYSNYLPIMFDGLCESEYPYNVLASYAVHDMLNAASDKIFALIPQIIQPIRQALNTKNPFVISSTCRVIQHMCMCNPCIGLALVPYYRQFLPTLNMFNRRGKNLRDQIDFQRVERLSDTIELTLMTLERCGGPNAYMNIKFAIPTYDSCVTN